MEIKIYSLFSGSSGNCTWFKIGDLQFLVDAGGSCKAINDALGTLGSSLNRISHVFVTHEHSDHVKGAGVLSRKLDLPIYATAGTWMGMEQALGEVPAHHRIEIEAGESFFLNDLEVVPFSIPHDAGDPVGYRIYAQGFSAAVATDLGYFAPTVRDAVEGADVVLLESNHDPEMLRRNPHYPQHLKSRILGRKGHLSNESGAEAAVELAQSGTRHLLLGHLSSENNTPELAMRTVQGALEKAGAEIGRDVTLHVAGRFQPSHLYRMK